MISDADFLPTNLADCQRLLVAAYKQALELERRAAEAETRAEELASVLEATAASFEELRQKHAAVLEELALYKEQARGHRRERLADGEGQPALFDAPDESPSPNELEPPAAEEPPRQVAAHTRRPRGAPDWSRLPRRREELDLPPGEKVCGCCQRHMERIGEDVTRILDFTPAKLEVLECVRPKYACRRCQDRVASPPPPQRPIDRGLAGPGLVAQVVVGKFGDHLPLYRLEDIFARHGSHLARSTLCDWVAGAAELLRPLYVLQRDLALRSAVLWTDDTRVAVLGDQGGCRNGRFWTYVGDQEQPYSVYDFTLTRERDGPAKFLKTYRGYLHADAYTGYDAIYLGSASGILEVACWTHARRKFFEARKNYPRQAHQVLEWVRRLYDIEDRARPLGPDERRALRQAESEPLLDKIEAYLAELAATVLPKSLLAKAVTYARNQWAALRRFTSDGRLTIDNNTAERTLRHQAVGRKNWLFLGSGQAGPRAAVLYTILAGAKRHRLEPWAYVRDLLIELRAGGDLHALLPDKWAAAHPESVLSHRLEESRQKAAAQQDRRRRRRILAANHQAT